MDFRAMEEWNPEPVLSKTTAADVTCPWCDGDGTVSGFACPGFRPVVTSCGECGGTGQWPRERMERYERGRAIMGERRANRRGLFQEARELGVSVTVLAHCEQGHDDPTEWALVDAARAARDGAS